MGRLRWIQNARSGDEGTEVLKPLFFKGTSATFNIGDSSTAESYTAGTPRLAMYFTSSNTTSTNAEPFYIKSTMTGAGGYGGRSTIHAYTNVSLGSNFGALKTYAEFGNSGRCAGHASSINIEMKLPNESIVAAGGAYSPLKVEYVAGGTSLATAGSLTGNYATFAYFGNSGDANGDFDDNGFWMVTKGLTAGAGHVLYNNTLRMGIGTTTWYLPLSSAQGSFTTAYPIVSTYLAGTQVNLSGTLTEVATGRGIKSAHTIAAMNFADGYGKDEFELTVTGTSVGHKAAMSSWVNVPSGTHTAGGALITPLTVGVWEDGAATITGASVIFGMRMQAILGDTDAGRLCPFDINVSGDTINAIWNAGDPAHLGYAADASTDSAKCGDIPFMIDSNSRVYYIRIYDAAS